MALARRTSRVSAHCPRLYPVSQVGPAAHKQPFEFGRAAAWDGGTRRHKRKLKGEASREENGDAPWMPAAAPQPWPSAHCRLMSRTMPSESLRFYIHHENEPEFALAVSWNVTDRRTVRDLSKHFAAAFARAFPHHAPTNFTLATESKLPYSACVCSCVHNGADLFATLAPVDAAATAPITAAAAPPKPAATGSSSPAAIDATLKPYLEAADTAYKARCYAKAKAIYTELITVVPTLGVALYRLGEIEAQAGRHDDACLLLERALKVDPASVPVAIALAKAQLASGDAAEAAGVVKATLARWEGKTSAAAVAKVRTLKIELGRTLFAGGARQEGGQLLTEILSQDMEKQDALEVRLNPRPRPCLNHTGRLLSPRRKCRVVTSTPARSALVSLHQE